MLRGGTRQTTAVFWSVVLVLSAMAIPVGAEVKSGGTVDGGSGPAPSVTIADATINDSTTSEIEVAYNASGEASLNNLELVVQGPDPETFYAKAVESDAETYGFKSNLTDVSGTVNVTIPPDTFEGGNFTLDAGLRLKSGSTLATDSSLLNVSTQVTIQSVTLNKTTVYEGKDVRVETVLDNPTDSAENFTVSTVAGSGYPSTADMVTVPANSQKTVTQTVSFMNPGDASLQTNRHPMKTVNVLQSPVEMEAAYVNESSVSPGDTVEVNISATNTLDSSFTETITLRQNGSSVASTQVDFAAGETKNATFTKQMTIAGGHSLGTFSEQTSVVVSSNDVAVEGFSLSSNPSYVNEPVTITATINNTVSSERTFSLAGWADGSNVGTESVTLTPDEKRSVQLTAEGYNFYQAGEYNVTVNGEPNKTLTVQNAFEQQGVHLSKNAVALGETVTVNMTYKNTAGSKKTKNVFLYAGRSMSTDLTLASGATGNASFDVSFAETGPQYIWADGASETIYVLSDTTGTPDISVQDVYEPSKVVNNSSSYIPVEILNDGDASGVKDVTLAVDGTDVTTETVYADPGEFRTVGIEHTFTTKGEKTVEVKTDGSSRTFTVNVTGPVVVDGSVSVEHVGGKAPSKLPNVSPEFSGGFIDVQVTNGGSFGYDLSEIGADSTTEFQINFTTKDYSPEVLSSSGRNLDWTVSPGPKENQTNVSITVQPSQLDFKTQFEGGYPTSASEWDSAVRNDVADFGWDAAILLGMGEATGDFTDANPSDLGGMTVSTDAQVFSMPTYVPAQNGQPAQLRIPLAAPHKTVNGNVNHGHYEAFVPDALLDSWGVTDPESELKASFTGAKNTNLQVTEVDGGVELNLSLHYSSGTVNITPDVSESSSSTTDTSSSGNDWTYSAPSSTDDTDDTDDAEGADETTVSVAESTVAADGTQTASAAVEDAKANSTVSVTFADESDESSSSDTRVDQLNVSLSEDSTFNVSVRTSGEEPAEVGDAGTPEGVDAVSYVEVEHDELPEDSITAAALTFSVGKDRFGDGFDPANAAVYRLHDGEWTELDTALVGETDETYRFRADSPGLSVFTVAEKTPDLSVQSRSLSASEVAIGEDVTASVTVTNDGSAGGDYVAELGVDGDVVATKTVTVEAGDTETVSLAWDFGGEGDYSVSVNGEAVGTVSVQADQVSTTTTATTTAPDTATEAATDTPSETTTTDTDTPGFGVGVALVALVGAALVRRRE